VKFPELNPDLIKKPILDFEIRPKPKVEQLSASELIDLFKANVLNAKELRYLLGIELPR
jgi:hypothetical protein